MSAPTVTFAGSSGFTATGTTETITGVSWGAGDDIYVLGETADNTHTLTTPTASGLTFSGLTGSPTNTANSCKGYAWKATAASSGSSVTISTTKASATGAFIVAWVVSSGTSDGNDNPAILVSTADTVSDTRSGDNMAILWAAGDWNATNDTTVASSPAGGTQRVAKFLSGEFTGFAFDWGDQGAAGTTSYGISGFTTSANFTKIAVGIKGHAASGATVPLDTAAGVSTATLALTAQTAVALGTSAAQSAGTLALQAPTRIALGAAAGQSAATLALSAPTKVTLGTSAATSTGTLALNAPTTVPLGTSAAQSAATLALTAGGATVPLGTSAAQSAGTLALTAPTRVALGTSAGQSSATLALTAQTYIPLGSSTGQSAATLAVYTPSSTIPMGTSAATSNATLAVTARTMIPLDPASGQSTGSLAVRAATRVVLQASAASSTGTLGVFTPSVAFVVLAAAAGTSAAGVLALSTIPPVPLGHVDGASGTSLDIEGASSVTNVDGSFAATGLVD